MPASAAPGPPLPTLIARMREALERVMRDPGPALDGLHDALADVLAVPAFAQGLVPRLGGGWRGRAPYLAQTERILRDPVGALPHHPLVLHRGGYPDGA